MNTSDFINIKPEDGTINVIALVDYISTVFEVACFSTLGEITYREYSIHNKNISSHNPVLATVAYRDNITNIIYVAFRISMDTHIYDLSLGCLLPDDDFARYIKNEHSWRVLDNRAVNLFYEKSNSECISMLNVMIIKRSIEEAHS